MALFQRKAEPKKEERKVPYTLKTKLLIRVDKIMDGQFAGLYQLASIDRNGNETIITDANNKVLIIANANKLLQAVD